MTERRAFAPCCGAIMICLALAARTGRAADQPLQQSLGPYLTASFKTPDQYIRDKFKSHDLVIVGEFHHVKQGLDLLHRVLPTLYRDCGVRFLGYRSLLHHCKARLRRLSREESMTRRWR
jgi:hypothetical protein